MARTLTSLRNTSLVRAHSPFDVAVKEPFSDPRSAAWA